MDKKAGKTPEKMTAREVKDAIRRRHGFHFATPRPGEWVCIEEAFSGFASVGGGIDVLAVGVWRTAKVPGLVGGRQGGYEPHCGLRS
jgi:hypothetical protein